MIAHKPNDQRHFALTYVYQNQPLKWNPLTSNNPGFRLLYFIAFSSDKLGQAMTLRALFNRKTKLNQHLHG